MGETTTGTVKKYFEKTDGKPYAVYIGDTKYSTFQDDRIPDDLAKGDEIELDWFVNEKGYKTIEHISRTDTNPENADNQQVEGSERSEDDNQLATEERITRNVALKAAVRLYSSAIQAGTMDKPVTPEIKETAEEFEDWLSR